MDIATHYNKHQTTGTQFSSGFIISGYTLDTEGDTAVTYGLSSGGIFDEDIELNIVADSTPTNPFEQNLLDPAQIPVTYRSGTTGEWYQDTPTNFPFKNVTTGNQRIAYNQWTGSTWQQTEVTDQYFVAYWVFATNNPTYPIISIQGQRQDSSLTNAINNNKYEDLDYGVLPAQEMKLLYRIIYRTRNTYTGTRKARLVHVEDLRNNAYTKPDVYVPLWHCALRGKTEASHPASSIYPDTKIAASGTSQSISSQTYTKVSFSTLSEDKNNECSNNTFTSKTNQIVTLNFVGTLNGCGSGVVYEISVQKNGTIIGRNRATSGAGLLGSEDITSSIHLTTPVSVGDTLEMYVYNSEISTNSLVNFSLEIISVGGLGL